MPMMSMQFYTPLLFKQRFIDSLTINFKIQSWHVLYIFVIAEYLNKYRNGNSIVFLDLAYNKNWICSKYNKLKAIKLYKLCRAEQIEQIIGSWIRKIINNLKIF